jgi:hypothetical protein
MSVASAIATALGPKVIDIVGKSLEDKQEIERMTNELSQVAAQVVIAETQGESWLQRNWRPLLMVWFSILIGAYWFGFVPINMPLEVVQSLFDLVTLGMGGYIIGRSGEKMISSVAPIIAHKLK